MTMAAGKSEFTSEERRLLKALAGRLKAQERAGWKRTGESVAVSMRLDGGLLEAVKNRAERKGTTISEVMRQALEDYLGSEDS